MALWNAYLLNTHALLEISRDQSLLYWWLNHKIRLHSRRNINSPYLQMNVVLFSGFQENLVMNKSIHCCISFPLFIHYTDESQQSTLMNHSLPLFPSFIHHEQWTFTTGTSLYINPLPPPNRTISPTSSSILQNQTFFKVCISYYINYISSIHSARSSKFTGESQGDLCPAETVSHHLYLRAKRHRAIVLRESILVKRTRNQSNLWFNGTDTWLQHPLTLHVEVQRFACPSSVPLSRTPPTYPKLGTLPAQIQNRKGCIVCTSATMKAQCTDIT